MSTILELDELWSFVLKKVLWWLLPSKVVSKKAACLQKGAVPRRQVSKTGKAFPALLAAARVHDIYEQEGSSV